MCFMKIETTHAVYSKSVTHEITQAVNHIGVYFSRKYRFWLILREKYRSFIVKIASFYALILTILTSTLTFSTLINV